MEAAVVPVDFAAQIHTHMIELTSLEKSCPLAAGRPFDRCLHGSA